VPLIDPRTGLIDRAWYLFFLSLLNAATSIDDVKVGTDTASLIASYDAALQALAQEVETQPPPIDLSAELIKQIEAAGLIDCCSGLVSQVAEMQKQLEALNLLPPSSLGTVTVVTATAPVESSGGTAPDISLAAGYGDTKNPYGAKTDNYVLAAPNGLSGVPTFRALVAADIPALPYGTGTVTSASVVSANGFAGTVATATTTPAITLTTTITGLLKGNGTAISAATSGTDYAPATSGTSILYGNGSGGFSNVTVGTGLSFSAGTLSASSGTAPATKTADFTVGATETWLINNKSGSTCTVTLPAASSWTGRTLTFKNMQAQTLVSASSNVVPIDSTSAGTAILLAVVGNWATMVSDGTNWVIMQQAANNCLLLE
jgi:hypothetical protein